MSYWENCSAILSRKKFNKYENVSKKFCIFFTKVDGMVDYVVGGGEEWDLL